MPQVVALTNLWVKPSGLSPDFPKHPPQLIQKLNIDSTSHISAILIFTMDTVATKADISRLEQSTKADIQKLRIEIKAQRSDSKRIEKSLRREILKVEQRVENIEDGQKRIEAKVDRVLNTLDSFVGRLDTLETENEVGSHQIRELDVRVTKLESSSHTA